MPAYYLLQRYNLKALLNSSLGGVQFGIDGEGNRCYLGADGSLIPFKSSGIVEELVKSNASTYYSLTTTKDYGFIVAFIACPYYCQVTLNGVYENKYNYDEAPRSCVTHTYVFTNVKAGTNIVASTTSTTNAMAYIVGIE